MLSVLHKSVRTAARQTLFALRCAAAVPARLLVTLLAGVAVWCSIFNAADQAALLESQLHERSTLGDAPAYKLSIRRSPSEQRRAAPPNMPSQVVEAIQAADLPSLFLLRQDLRVGNPSREKVLRLDVAVLHRPATQAPSAHRPEFPPCYLVGAHELSVAVGSLLPVGEHWRCRLAASPPELLLSAVSTDHSLIVFEAADAQTTLGPLWNTTTESMVVGFADTRRIKNIEDSFGRYSRDTLQIDRVADSLPMTGVEMTEELRIWSLCAKLGLAGALLFYAQGSWPAARREAALRACIGHGRLEVGSWFFRLSMVQSGLMAAGSWLMACFAYEACCQQQGHVQGLPLLGNIAILICAWSASTAGVLVWVLFKKNVMTEWLR